MLLGPRRSIIFGYIQDEEKGSSETRRQSAVTKVQLKTRSLNNPLSNRWRLTKGHSVSGPCTKNLLFKYITNLSYTVNTDFSVSPPLPSPTVHPTTAYFTFRKVNSPSRFESCIYKVNLPVDSSSMLGLKRLGTLLDRQPHERSHLCKLTLLPSIFTQV